MADKKHNDIINDSWRMSIDSIIYGSYVKNDRMDRIVFEAFNGSHIASATDINIFIDVYSVLHSVFSEHYRIDYTNYTDITSCLINMCGHYRSFFRRLGVNTTFYMVFSTNCCEINRKFVADYNEVFYQKSIIPEFKKITEDNFKLLKALCPYLPDIHFISSTMNFESGVIIAYLIEKLNDGKPNMIISKDMYPLQLTYLYNNTTFLYPRKRKVEGDTSFLVPVFEKPNFRQVFWDINTNMRKMKSDKLYKLSPVNFSLLLAMNNFPDRNLKALYNITRTVNFIYDMVGPEDIRIDISQLNMFSSKFNVGAITARYNAIDIPFMLPYYKNSPECNNIKLINLHDDAVINQINAKYFANNPIDLMKL